MSTKIWCCCLLAALAGMASCRTNRISNWDAFKAEHAGEGFTIKVNGPLFKLGMGIASHADDDPETARLLKHLSRLRGVEVRTIPLKHGRDPIDLNRLSRLLEKDAYASIATIRDGADNIRIWAKGKEDELKDPLVLITDDDDLVIIELKGSVNADDIGALTAFRRSDD